MGGVLPEVRDLLAGEIYAEGTRNLLSAADHFRLPAVAIGSEDGFANAADRQCGPDPAW